MRHSVAWLTHSHEALFYVGAALALAGLALMGARRLWGERAVVAAAVGAMAVFAVSAFQMQPDGHNAETAKAEMADFDVIREKTRGKVVVVSPEVYRHRLSLVDYYLAGSVLIKESAPTFPQMSAADFVVSRNRDWEDDGFAPRAPENRIAFLHAVEPFGLLRAHLRRVESAEPDARSDFNLHIADGFIHYIKEPCAESDTLGRFFLSVRPVNPADLPERRRELGHDSLNFDFSPQGAIFGGKCAIRRALPDYAIAEISTGQDLPAERRAWSVSINPPLSAESVAYYESVYQDARASGELLIRSDFDVHLQGNALIYLKDQCAESDTLGRFFLSARPVDAADLPEYRRELGHESLNFDFSPDGVIFGEKCMIRRELPDYCIAEIATGQDIPGEGRAWSAAAKTVAHWESVYETAKASGEPLISAGFDVYSQDGALFYLREPCAESDARGRFFLSVHPVSADDLPESRRELGHDSLNFDFSPDGAIFGGKCVIRRELPDYDIAKIATGQDAPGEGRLWSGEAVLDG